jgi:Fe-S-cluster-containing dehydrogenase component
MKVRAQIGMVLNLDKCIGCHTCSVTCKNVWTSREGMEYAWFNNVETKPGIGYPKDWENQKRWNGGWVRKPTAASSRAMGGKWRCWRRFANPDLPEIDDYYEPFTFDYGICRRRRNEGLPDGAPAQPDHRRAHGEDRVGSELGGNLGGEFAKRSQDYNFEGVEKEIYGQFENTFMMYLPRLCEHCLNPACVAACPSGSIYKREEDGIVLIDQDKCRGWRMCVSGCPYKKIYYNWKSGKSEKCIFCYPRIEAGQPTVCSETCVGRIRYLGVMLYDADRIEEAASAENERSLSGAARYLPRSQRSAGDRAGAQGRRARSMAGGGAPFAGLEDGDGMEGRLPAAPRIPHAADGLVRAAAVADQRGGAMPARSVNGEMPDVNSCASRCVPRQPADRRRRGSRWCARSSGCWRCAPTCAPSTSMAQSTRRSLKQVGIDPGRGSRTCTT